MSQGYYDYELRLHRELLKSVMSAHKENKEMNSAVDELELVLEEEKVYPGIERLTDRYPPSVVKGKSGWIYHSNAFGCLPPKSFVRRTAIYVVEAPIFDPFILLTIMCNCVTMAWASPLDPPGTRKEEILGHLEWVYLFIFTFELVTKMLAYGLIVHKHSYLRDPWCQLDFVVVSLAWLPILFPAIFGNMSAIRSVRALRPLRALKRVPGMPVLVGSILKSMPAMGNVAGLAGFILLVFGIVGMNLFKGVLHYRCADPAMLEDYPDIQVLTAGDEAAADEALDERRRLTASLLQAAPALGGVLLSRLVGPLVPLQRTDLADDLAEAQQQQQWWRQQQQQQPPPQPPQQQRNASASAAHARLRRSLKGGREEFISSHPQADYDSGTLCYADARICAEVGQICVYFDANPDGDTVSFDSVSRAMLPILQAITFDTWTDPMFYVMDAYSFAAWGYFIAIAILGGMFVVNLFLAVIFDEFMRAQATEEAVEDLTSGATEGGAPLDSARGEADDLTLLPMPHSPGGETGSKHCCTRLDGGDCCDCSPASDEGCCGWRYTLRQAMLSSTLGNISTFFVVFNLFLMCLPYAGQSKAYENDVEMASTVVTWIFVIEMFLKLLSMGCSEYWGDSWNVLDGIIVSISIVEIVITVLLADTGVNISFLRMLRLLRLLRLLKAWPGLYKIVMSFVKAIPQISNLCVLLFILMFIFALLGMQTFGGTAISEDSRWHFDYFYPAILTVFNIFTGGWVDAFQACSDEMGVLISTLYFVPALIIGFFIIMNLFVAILLEAFAGDEEEEGGDEGGDDEKKLELDVATGAEAETEVELIGPEPLEGVSLFCLGPANGFRQGCRWIAEHSIFDQFIILLIIASSVCLAIDVPRLDPDSELKAQLDRLNLIFTALFVLEMMLKIVAYGFLFTPKAYLKQGWNILDFFIVMISILGLLADIVPVFGKLKCLRILRVLRPLRLLARHPGMKILITSLIKTLPSVVEVFAVVFVFHVVFAIMGMQMFVGKFGACTDESIKVRAECYEPGSKHDPAVLAGATARLEKMRMLEDAAPMRMLEDAAPTTAPPRGWRMLEAFATPSWAPPAPPSPLALALSPPPPLLSPPLSSPPPLQELTEVEQEHAASNRQQQQQQEQQQQQHAPLAKQQQLERGRRMNERRQELRRGGAARRQLKGGGGGDDKELPTEWINPPYGSFDDWGQSMIILYIAATGDGWEAFMFAGMDATGVDMAPERNDFSAVAVFFLMWMLVGNFVSINLFVGSIVDNFTRIKKEDDGSATMTPEQTQWVNTIKGSSSEYANKAARKPRCDCCGLRNRAFELVNSRAFEFFVMGVILTNTFGMTLDFWRVEEHPKYDEYYDGTMMCFTYFYYAEFLIKFFALGCHYFADGWCRFDFFLVSISAVDQFAPLLLTVLPVPPTMLRVLRVMRVLRVLRLVKELKGLRDLVMTLVISVPALFNVGCLLGLVMFMYAVLGLNVFTYVQHSGAISADRNFESFGNAMLLLFQCLTGDGWSEIMDDSMITEERGCDPHPADGSPSDCGSKLALPYFMSFTVIGTFVMLNLVVAVILENFTSLGSVNPNLVSPDDIQDFKALWATFDPDANGLIPAKFLPALVKQLKPPIGIMGTPDGATNAKALRFCLSLGLTQSNGEVNFKIVLDTLINKNYKAQNVDIEEDVKTAKSPAVIEALELRRQYSEIPLSAVSAGRLKNSLTPRRRELSKVFAEEILRMFIRRKRKAWLKNPKSHPSYRGPGASPKKGKSVVLSEKPAPGAVDEWTSARERSAPVPAESRASSRTPAASAPSPAPTPAAMQRGAVPRQDAAAAPLPRQERAAPPPSKGPPSQSSRGPSQGGGRPQGVSQADRLPTPAKLPRPTAGQAGQAPRPPKDRGGRLDA